MSVVTLLNAVSANTTGPVAGLGTPYGNLTVSVSTTGTVSAFSVQVSGSLDGFNFESIGPAITSTTAGTSIGSGVLLQYFQAALSGYSGTGTITVELAYSLESSASGGGGGPPSGAAGGDLSGTYPNPVVAQIDGQALPLPVSLGGTGTATGAGQNKVLAGPTSGTGAPSFRSLVAADVPTLNQNTTGTAAGLSSTLAIGSGGTGTAAGAPQNDVFAGPATGGTGAPAFRALVAADLPAGTTGAKGALQLDGAAGDILPDGVAAAGANGLAADSGHVHPFQSWLSQYLAPTGATAETFPRFAAAATRQIVSGTLYLTAIALPAGLAVSNISYFVTTLGATITHGWYALANSSYVVEAVSADQTGGSVWTTTGVTQSLAMASPYTTPSAGLYYLALCITDTGTAPTFASMNSTMSGTLAALSPFLCGTATGQATPPSTGATLGTPTGTSSGLLYGWTH